MVKPMYFLADGDNFFCSAESLYAPHLKKKELIVLSSGDGCVVARSKLAKNNGIKMGVPYFKIRDAFEARGGVALSSNFPLYAHVSTDVAYTLESLLGECHRYSIDESFGVSTGFEHEIRKAGGYEAYGRLIKKKVMQHTGICISVGVGATKTLAKAAAGGAKKYPGTKGVVAIESEERLEKLLKLTPVGSIWGVGRRFEEKLAHENIYTGWDLKCANQMYIRKKYGVVLQRVIAELNGEVCFDLELDAPQQKQMVSSKTLTTKSRDFNEIRGHLSGHVEKLLTKIRKKRMLTSKLTVFVQNSPFDKRDDFRHLSKSAMFSIPTNDTSKCLKVAHELLLAMWVDGLLYSKCGIMLSDLIESGHQQFEMFVEEQKEVDSNLVALMDRINAKHTKGVSHAVSLLSGETPKSARHSPNYTGSWLELPKVR